MPLYSYEHPNTGEITEVFQGMKEPHQYIDEDGVEWKRVFTSPQGLVKGKQIDLRSQKDRDLYNSVYKKRYEYNKKKGKIDKNGNER